MKVKVMVNNENNIKELRDKEMIEEYKGMLQMELLALKVPFKEILTLVTDELVINAIRNHRKVEDIAWAIIQ